MAWRPTASSEETKVLNKENITHKTKNESKIQQSIQENYISGTFVNPIGSLDAMIKLNDNLNGVIEFSAGSREDVQTFDRSESKFISNIDPQFGTYRIKFIPLIQQITYSSGNENPKGKFITLISEIKEFNDP